MKFSFAVLFACFVSSAIGFGQTSSTPELAQSESMTPVQWLDFFKGNWKTVSVAPGKPESQGSQGTMTSRRIGGWMVNEYKAKMGGMNFNAIQSVAYDGKTKKFKGSWIDSAMDFEWKYDGRLSDDGKQLILSAEGPDWTKPGQMKNYRDIYEFVAADKIAATSQMQNNEGKWDTFMTASMKRETKSMDQTVTPFLMFTGKAEAAIDLYKTVFPKFEIVSMEKYGPDEQGAEGTIKLATIKIEGQAVKVIDSPPVHDFDFTPSFSFFVECESEEQVEERFKKLSADGKVMMPLNNYGFSKKFGWVSDKYGVSWQLNFK